MAKAELLTLTLIFISCLVPKIEEDIKENRLFPQYKNCQRDANNDGYHCMANYKWHYLYPEVVQ